MLEAFLNCDRYHCVMVALCIGVAMTGIVAREGSEMPSRQHPDELRLQLQVETRTLISDQGGEAHLAACQRGQKIRSRMLAMDGPASPMRLRADMRPNQLYLGRLPHNGF